MAKIIHAMFRVIDEERSRDFYARAFGLEAADRYEFDGFTLVYLRNREADFEVELTINHGRTEPYDLGDGYGHIAVAVNDLDAEHRRGPESQPDQGVHARRRADGALLLRAGPRRLQGGGAPAAWPLPLNHHAEPPSTKTNKTKAEQGSPNPVPLGRRHA
jgi:lactoylglutathione lyase